MLGVFPLRTARLEVKRIGIGTHWITEGARAARVVSAPSRVNARRNRRQMAEGRRLLLPVMIFPSPWSVWRFREITGEIFLRVRRAQVVQGRRQGNPQGEKALIRNVKILIQLGILMCKFFRASGLAIARTSA